MNIKKLFRNETIFIIIGIFLIVAIIAYGISKHSTNNYANIKKDSNEYLVYTKSIEENEDYSKIVPYLNIKGSLGEKINKNIDDFVSQYTNDLTNITYEYNVNGIVLSLIIKVEDDSIADQATIASFTSYNINLDTLELLSNEVLFKYFNTNEETIKNVMYEKLNKYYNNLLEKNYIDQNECDFDCFLSSRNITNYMENAEYIVRNGNLILFEPMDFLPLDSNEKIKYAFKVAEG